MLYEKVKYWYKLDKYHDDIVFKIIDENNMFTYSKFLDYFVRSMWGPEVLENWIKDGKIVPLICKENE